MEEGTRFNTWSPDSDNEWVNWNDMHADEALEEFRQHNPSSVTHKNTIRAMPFSCLPLPPRPLFLLPP
jgi:hypothetical protein